MLLHRRSKNSKSPTLSSNSRVCFLIERTKYTNKTNETTTVYQKQELTRFVTIGEYQRDAKHHVAAYNHIVEENQKCVEELGVRLFSAS